MSRSSYLQSIINPSFTDTQAITSTPAFLKTGYKCSYLGKCVDEQVGVKAPGKEKTTTVLPLKNSSVLISNQSPSY